MGRFLVLVLVAIAGMASGGGGDRGWMLGSITGLVTRVSRQPNGSHWVTVEKDPDADCRARGEIRRDRCARWGLGISDETVVLRGETRRGRRPPPPWRRTRRSAPSPATP